MRLPRLSGKSVGRLIEVWVGDTWYNPLILVAGVLTAGVIWPLSALGFRYRIAAFLLFITTIGSGVAIALDALQAPHGYVVPYNFVAAWTCATLLVIGGTVLLIAPRTRRHGVCGVLAGALLLGSFYGTYLSGVQLGYARWQHQRQIEIPAKAP